MHAQQPIHQGSLLGAENYLLEKSRHAGKPEMEVDQLPSRRQQLYQRRFVQGCSDSTVGANKIVTDEGIECTLLYRLKSNFVKAVSISQRCLAPISPFIRRGTNILHGASGRFKFIVGSLHRDRYHSLNS